MSKLTPLIKLIVFSCAYLCLVKAGDEWYDKNVIYQIYPKSFFDSDGDGIGDLKGIAEKAEYFKDLGVGAVWLSPIFKSPMQDNGYDISDYKEIASIFGTLDDFKDMISKLHGAGIKVLLDLVPNHTSKEHQWFKDSNSKKNGKDNYYVWVTSDQRDNEGNRIVPNNWVSMFGGSAWTYSESREQFYLHQFGDYQPDLNYRNKEVINEMKNIMTFWLDLEVDGFRVDAVPYLVEDEKFQPESVKPYCDANLYDCLIHNKTKDQPETFKVLEELGKVLDSDKYKDKPKKLLLEAYTTLENTMKYYSKNASPFNFNLLSLNRDSNATDLENIIQDWLNHLPHDKNTIWVIGNHDNSRVGSRMGPDMIDPMNMLIFMLPGNTVTYYGEELGMEDTHIKDSEKQDKTRDPERTPMQWTGEANAGFTNDSSTSTWLPINSNYWEINFKEENDNPGSHIGIYKKLIKLQNEIIGISNYTPNVIDDWIFVLERANYVFVLNLDDRDHNVNLTSVVGELPAEMPVSIASVNSGFKEDESVKTEGIKLRPRSAVILKTHASGGAITITISFFILSAMAILHLF